MFELKKIGIVKRASALLLDAILLAVLTTGFMWIISLICNYGAEEQRANSYYAEWENFRKEYIPGVASYYGFTYQENGDGSYKITINETGAETSLDTVIAKLDASEGKHPETEAAYEKYLTLPPVAKVNMQYQYVYTMLFMMISVGLVLAYLILEFIIPIFLKNGQTVGKKVFGIGLVRADCVKIKTIALFARTLLGKFAIETMFPILLAFLFFFGGLGILAIILFAAMVLLNVVLFFATKNRTPIHDIIAGTVAVDLKVQAVYDTPEELAERKAQAQRAMIEASREGYPEGVREFVPERAQEDAPEDETENASGSAEESVPEGETENVPEDATETESAPESAEEDVSGDPQD